MSKLPTVQEVASRIDHAILSPTLSDEVFFAELDKAIKLKLFSVCVRPVDVRRAYEYLEGSGVVVGTVVGFPHGSSTIRTKSFESFEAIQDGAVEIDVVMNQSAIHNGKLAEEIEDLNIFARESKMQGASVVKIIFENANLTDEQIAEISKGFDGTDIDFIKTSTGYASSGATAKDVETMVANRGSNEVKASGGIRTVHDLINFWNQGVTRFGTSNSETILNDLEKLHNGELDSATVGGEY